MSTVPQTKPPLQAKPLPKPPWLKVKFPGGERFNWIREKSRTLKLATVCEEARCPNIGECWNGGTATFMLMGDTCTRGCRFCSVKTLKTPAPLDVEEPEKLAETIANMQLSYVVLTSVDRDDLADQGAPHLVGAIKAVQERSPTLMIEILIPDFRGQLDLIQLIIDAKPTVIAHNLETVERLTQTVRDPRAGYQQSLDVLAFIKRQNPKALTKSSLMLGLGESQDEVLQAMADLRQAGVDFLTLGQYLQPTQQKLKVQEYIHPSIFEKLGVAGEEMGFSYVASGPLVRSSYRAAEFYIERKVKESRT